VQRNNTGFIQVRKY